jgi:ATP-binding cassette subfamily C protein
VTLDLPVGSITVVSGPSGAGKTTLADVLMGLVAPDQGALFIDDMPLDAAGRLAWRQAVSYVPQEVVIYAGTLRGNLARACPDATDAQMHAALGAAAADFTANWPAGLDTLIGPGGRQLSGGERQRLALARGLLRQPSLLILDEVSSALDPENEGRIRDSVAQLAGRITTVILGHSAAFDSIATQHYMLNAGRGQRAPAPRRTEPAA